MFRAHRGPGQLHKLTWTALWSDFDDIGAEAEGFHTAPVALPVGFLVVGGTFRVITEFKTAAGGGATSCVFATGPSVAYPNAWSSTASRELTPDGNLQGYSPVAANQPGHDNQNAIYPIVRCEVKTGVLDFTLVDQGEVEVTLFYAKHPGV
jgi:hypothetical protein